MTREEERKHAASPVNWKSFRREAAMKIVWRVKLLITQMLLLNNLKRNKK